MFQITLWERRVGRRGFIYSSKIYKVEYLIENYHELTEINKRIFWVGACEPRSFIMQPTCTSIQTFKIVCNSFPASLQSRHISHWATLTLVSQQIFFDFKYLLRPFTLTRPEISEHKLSSKRSLFFSSNILVFTRKHFDPVFAIPFATVKRF
jgi:Zn-finger domain-containing protein